MAATSITHIPGGNPGVSFGGKLVRFFERMIETQEVRARVQVQAILRDYSDTVLKDIGYTASDIRKLRRGEPVGPLSARD